MIGLTVFTLSVRRTFPHLILIEGLIDGETQRYHAVSNHLEIDIRQIKNIRRNNLNREKVKEFFTKALYCNYSLIDGCKDEENAPTSMVSDGKTRSTVLYSPFTDKILILKGDETVEIKSRLNRRDRLLYHGQEYVLHTTPITGRITLSKAAESNEPDRGERADKKKKGEDRKDEKKKRLITIGKGRLDINSAVLEILPQAEPPEGRALEEEALSYLYPELLLGIFLRHQGRLKLNHY